jgi:hypothetical protein
VSNYDSIRPRAGIRALGLELFHPFFGMIDQLVEAPQQLIDLPQRAAMRVPIATSMRGILLPSPVCSFPCAGAHAALTFGS